MPEKPVKN